MATLLPPSRKRPPRNSPKTSSRPSSSASNVWKRKKTISDEIRDVYAEAKGNWLSTSKHCAPIVRLRKQDANERAEEETILETYMPALGMLKAMMSYAG